MCIPFREQLQAKDQRIAAIVECESQRMVAEVDPSVEGYEDAQFIALSREALPYWIERAEAAERAVGELITQVVKLYHCPPISKRIYCQSSTKETRVEECTVCWREWAMKEGK